MNEEAETLRKLFAGKNTLELARILADVFVARFGEHRGGKGEILKCLLPKGRAGSWSDLDRHITSFCKQFHLDHERHTEIIQFLDELRFVIEALPQRQDYKPPEDKEEYPTPKEAAYHFVMCSLCWRAVARRPLEKKTPLCHIHDLPSTQSEYRRRARMRRLVEERKLELVKSLPSLWELRRQHGRDLEKYLQGLCLGSHSSLPYLASYLQSLGKAPACLSLQTKRDIVEALEYPVYLHKLSPHIQEAWGCYFADRATYFKLLYVKLLTAEAWLAEDAKRQHGGKRR